MSAASGLEGAGAAAARQARLRWATDATPGITRRRRGPGFSYFRPDGSAVRDAQTLRRIRGLVIPPAWTRVWISTDPIGHIQATGRDARGRKQYRYHARWREMGDEDKYDRTVEFARALPRIRSRVSHDLRRHGLERERVLAAVVRLLDETLVRIGNSEYATTNRSYGLTTMRASHASIHGDSIHLSFRGKGGKRVTADVRDRRVATVMERCTALPGEELFQYVDDDGAPHAVTSDDVNSYIREATGGDYSAKDFRTWAGTVIAARALSGVDATAPDGVAKEQLNAAVRLAADHLGNTVAVCRRCYIHPRVLSAYREGSLPKMRSGRPASSAAGDPAIDGNLRADERAVLRLLGGDR